MTTVEAIAVVGIGFLIQMVGLIWRLGELDKTLNRIEAILSARSQK